MKKNLIKFMGICFILSIFSISLVHNVYAAGEDIEVDGFNIIPELTETEINELDKKIEQIGRTGKNVRNEYNQVASELTTSQQIATGIMNRDTILNYLTFIVKFMSQLGLVVGAVFIMYSGYQYMISVLKGTQAPSTGIKNAIIGVTIVIFSYAILKTLTSIIGLS